MSKKFTAIQEENLQNTEESFADSNDGYCFNPRRKNGNLLLNPLPLCKSIFADRG